MLDIILLLFEQFFYIILTSKVSLQKVFWILRIVLLDILNNEAK